MQKEGRMCSQRQCTWKFMTHGFSLSLSLSDFLFKDLTLYQVVCKDHFHSLSSLIISTILWGTHYNPHCTEEKTENQDGGRLRTGPRIRPYDWEMWVPGLELRSHSLHSYCCYVLPHSGIISLCSATGTKVFISVPYDYGLHDFPFLSEGGLNFPLGSEA